MSLDVKRARWVRKTEDGVYTIEPQSVLERTGLICNSCGIKTGCPIYKVVEKAEPHADVHIRKCQRYVPILSFRKPLIGLNQSSFNTMRAGTTWMDRLEIGKTVALVGADDGEIIRFMKVRKLYSGDFDAMVAKHSMFNHLAMGGKPVDKVGEILRKSYGHFLNEQSKLTAIYLEPVADDDQIREKVLRGRASKEEA